MKITALKLSISSLVLATLISGCDQPQGSANATAKDVASAATGAQASTVNSASLAPTLPPDVANIAIEDAKEPGYCFVDEINGITNSSQPVAIKAGSKLSLAGWSVSDLKAGVPGSHHYVQLFAKQSFFTPTETYVRPGLGNALGNAKLDSAAVKLDVNSVSIPTGSYKVLLLSQEGDKVLRCDSGWSVTVN